MNALSHSRHIALLLACLTLVSACASEPMLAKSASFEVEPDRGNRLLIRSGDVTISVDDPADMRKSVEEILSNAKGFVEHSTTDESTVWLTCRVPAKSLDATMEEIAKLGRLVRRSVSSSDVTDQHADLSARLAISRQLRDRMRDLLERATEIKDLLAIEKELARVQSEIEMMEGQLERLDSQIALSSLSVSIEQERILGPLGFVGYWTGWAFSKLFIIR
jgi:hypothetical protein